MVANYLGGFDPDAEHTKNELSELARIYAVAVGVDSWVRRFPDENERRPMPGPIVTLNCFRRRIAVDGDLDYLAVKPLSGAVDVSLKLRPGDLTIDLAKAKYIDAAGLDCLVRIKTALSYIHAALCLVHVPAHLRQKFTPSSSLDALIS